MRFPSCFVLLLLLPLALPLAGCRTVKEVRDPNRCAPDAEAQYFDLTQKKQGESETVDPATCKHAFEQIGVHQIQKMQNGMAIGGLCVINRCLRCQEVRHECNPAYRGTYNGDLVGGFPR